MERLIAIIGGVEIIAGGIMSAFPELLPQWISLVIVALGTVTLGYGILGFKNKGVAYYGSPQRNKWLWNWGVKIKFDSFFWRSFNEC